MRQVLWTDLGRAAYEPVWALQRALVDERKSGSGDDRLLLVEHDPVVTLGRRADEGHLLVDRERLRRRGIDVFDVERGGDVTYHGPGQLVGYPILDLRAHRKDVRWYSGALAEIMVRALASLGIEARPATGRRTGVWVGSSDAESAKIGMIGVRIERWVTYHGFALNVGSDVAGFGAIVPCGLPEADTTSASACLGREVALAEARMAVLDAFADVFQVRTVRASLPAPTVTA